MEYIKEERQGGVTEGHPVYYFVRDDNCDCKNAKDRGFDECNSCAKKSTKIERYLEKNDDDYWNARKVISTTKTNWKRKLKQGKEVLQVN